jgi:dihydropteroate synthase
MELWTERITMNLGGELLMLDKPKVMGILNVTSNSFYDGGKYISDKEILEQAEKMLEEGATFLDIGAMSSKPGSTFITEEEELSKVVHAIKLVKNLGDKFYISVDTWRSKVLSAAHEVGALLANDISAGSLDKTLWETVSKLKMPYVLMHMQGTPETMQQNPVYSDVVTEVMDFFIPKIKELRDIGVKDILLDVGFGFGKNLEHNFQLLKNLEAFSFLEHPLLVGLSRKSIICKTLGVDPKDALNGTTALNMMALQNGAKILRVHDVKPALEAIKLFDAYCENI